MLQRTQQELNYPYFFSFSLTFPELMFHEYYLPGISALSPVTLTGPGKGYTSLRNFSDSADHRQKRQAYACQNGNLIFLIFFTMGSTSLSPSLRHPFSVFFPQYGHFSARSGMLFPQRLQIMAVPPISGFIIAYFEALCCRSAIYF